MFATYTEARNALDTLNASIREVEANPPAMDAGTEAHFTWLEKRRALSAEGETAGFSRIFDGSFKLTRAMIALPF